MRFETIIACQYLVWRLDYAQVVRSIKDDGDTISLVLENGQRLLLLLIERGINLDEVRYHYESNSKAGIYTLMMPWLPMFLPHDGEEADLKDWISALMGLHAGKLYGYDVSGRDAFFFPVELLGEGQKRRVRFGNLVSYAAISGKKVRTLNPYVPGEWLVAGFENADQTYRRQHSGNIPKDPLRVYFDILGLPRESDFETVKRAYRALARLYHPDLNASQEADARMKRINLAYSKLSEHFE